MMLIYQLCRQCASGEQHDNVSRHNQTMMESILRNLVVKSGEIEKNLLTVLVDFLW